MAPMASPSFSLIKLNTEIDKESLEKEKADTVIQTKENFRDYAGPQVPSRCVGGMTLWLLPPTH
jgi:hypothetical protein